MNLVDDIHAQRESRLTAVLEGTRKVEARIQLCKQQNRKDYPTLSCYKIPSHECRMCGNLLQDLYAYNCKVPTAAQ
jgi:hypothetical protein